MKYVLCLYLITLFIYSCNHEKIEKNDNFFTEIIKIDPTLQKKYIQLSEVFDSVKIIPLQTLSECLIGEISTTIMDDKYIYILDKPRESILIFSKEGYFIHKICNPGKGPGEYLNILDMFLDSRQKRIIIVSSNKIQFYSINSFKLIEEYQKKIFGVQYWYLSNNIFAAFAGNMVNNTNHNLLLFKKNRIIEKYFKIDNDLLGYNYSLNNNFSLKNDSNITYFSLPFDRYIYKIDEKNLNRRIKLDYADKTIPKKIFENNAIEQLTEKILSSGYFYGEEDIFKDNDFLFFKFRGDKKVFHCFINEKKELKFSNVIVDDLTSLPFHGFQFGSLGKKYLTSYGYIDDIHALIEIYKNNPQLDKNILYEKIPQYIYKLYELYNLNSNPFIICFYF